MTGDDAISGIVLAGGGSVRFGSDKLAALVGGSPLVHLAIAAVAAVATEVVLVVGAEDVLPLPGNLRVPLRIVRDDEPGAGPLAALLTGLEKASAPRVLVVAGDMPTLVPDLLRDLARRVCAVDVDAVALRDGERTRPLPAAFRRASAIDAARSLRATGGSSLRALLTALRVDAVPECDWRSLDPAGASLLDIDRPEDLERAEVAR